MQASQPSFINFAYGSNMLHARIRERVPSAQVLGAAVLRGYALKWHKSGKDGSGKCDVVADPKPDAAVHGVLYEIPLSEKPALDRAEGLGFGYDEELVQVEFRGKRISAGLYRASSINTALLPYSWYRALVIAGARQQQLPQEYIASLEAVAATEDPNAERHSFHLALSKNGA